jgi:hypothetical protein
MRMEWKRDGMPRLPPKANQGAAEFQGDMTMAEHHSGPAELGAPMDYAEHEKTYNFFLEATKIVTIFCVALLIAMAAGFFTSAGFFTAFVLFVLLNIAGFVLLR